MLIVYNPTTPKFNFERDMSNYTNYNPDYFKTTGNDDKRKLKHLLNKKKYELVVVIGGDGTVNLVASFLVNTNIKLAIIPRGSTNGLFYDLTSNDLPLSKRKVKHIDAIKIGEDYCFHLADFGFNAHIIKNTRMINTKRFFKYLVGFFKSLFEFKKYEFKVNDNKLKKRLLVIANGKGYGLKFRINSLGELDDGKFEVCTLNTQRSYSEVKIVNLDKSPFHIDGEFKGHPKEIFATIKKKSLKVLI